MSTPTVSAPAVLPSWKRRGTFLLAATGSAFGLGNIWKLPYITGLYGGGAFVLVFLGCILFVGIPIMMAETLLGRLGRANPITTMATLGKQAGRRGRWIWLGAMGVIGGLLIMMFYSVVAGWVLAFVVKTAGGELRGLDPVAIAGRFDQLKVDLPTQVLFHSLFVVLTGGIVAGGVTRGIGRAVEILMPVLFIFILLLLGYSMASADFAAGLRFMFTPNFSKLSGEAVLVAMGHAFFSLSLGMGAIMAYGAYMPSEASIGKTITAVALLDTLFGLMMGLCIFPLMFSNNLNPASGPSLLFKSLPIAFSAMPFGQLMGTVFFTLVVLAALTSSISLIEPGVAWLSEKKPLNRKTATLILSVVAWCGGMASIFWDSVFNFLDALTSRYLLPLGGLAIAIFAGWVMDKYWVERAIALEKSGLFTLWRSTLRYVSPVCITLIFLHSLGLFQ